MDDGWMMDDGGERTKLQGNAVGRFALGGRNLGRGTDTRMAKYKRAQKKTSSSMSKLHLGHDDDDDNDSS